MPRASLLHESSWQINLFCLHPQAILKTDPFFISLNKNIWNLYQTIKKVSEKGFQKTTKLYLEAGAGKPDWTKIIFCAVRFSYSHFLGVFYSRTSVTAMTSPSIYSQWAEVHISHQVIVFVFYGKKWNVFICFVIALFSCIFQWFLQFWKYCIRIPFFLMYSLGGTKIKSIRIRRDIDTSQSQVCMPKRRTLIQVFCPLKFFYYLLMPTKGLGILHMHKW